MAKARVELPNGKIATIEIPDGMSMEEASAELQGMYDSNPEQFEAAPQPDQSQWLQTSPDDGPGMSMVKEYANKIQGDPLGQYYTGMVNQIRGMGRGARQLFNVATGDDEELAQLNAEEEAIRARDAALTSNNPMLAGAGGVVGSLLPAAVPVGGALGGGASLLGRMGAGAVGGALAGGAQPLTTEEEQGGNRMAGALMGGAVGGAMPAVLSGGGAVLRALRRMEPDDALQRFTENQLNAARGSENLPAYREVADSVKNKESQLRNLFSERYGAVEGANSQSLPPVNLAATSELTKNMPNAMSDDLALALSPKARKTLQAIGQSSTHTSPIVDRTGANFERPEATSFSDVRETIRELRRVERVMMKNDATKGQAQQVARLGDALKGDLDEWATSANPVGPNRLTAARGIDSDYKREMLPFQSNQTNLGKYGKTDQYDEQTLDRMFMNNQSGQALADLLERVPEARNPLRQIYGSKLLQSRGTIGNIRQLEGGTAAEALLSRNEREYLAKIADTLRDQGPNELSIGMLNKLARMPGVRKMVAAATGVEPYSATPRGLSNNQYIIDALRGIAAGQSAQVLEE